MNRRELLRTLGGAGALVAIGACSAPDDSSTASNASPSLPSTAQSVVTSGAPSSSPTSVGEPATAPLGSSSSPGAVPATALPSSATGATMPTTGWSQGDPATYVNQGPSDRNVVALTFHFAGNPALVARLLDLLKANAVTSTLFAIGDWLTAHSTLGHRALADGHELGNHTKSHQPMLQLDRAHVFAEIAGGGKELVPFIGSIGRWFRPSGTDVPSSLILAEAGRVGYPVSVGYDIDSRDYTEPGAQAVIDNVAPNLHAGAVISLHFGHADTVSALPTILDRIAGLGLTTVTVSELLAPAAAP